MAKRKKLIGLDGKPLKYTPPPNEENVKEDARIAGQMAGYRIAYGLGGLNITIGEPARPEGPSLRERVAADLSSIDYPQEFEGRPELPEPERDLTTYQDALKSAQKNCKHPLDELVDTLHQREFQCTSCGKYLNLQEVKKIQNEGRRGLFGW